MLIDLTGTLVRMVAPVHLADAILGDLQERRRTLAQSIGAERAHATYLRDALHSVPALAVHNATIILASNWAIAAVAAVPICVACYATIPLWDQIGLGGPLWHVARLALIGLTLGSFPRASTLSCAFLLLMIAVGNWSIDAREIGGWHVFTQSYYYAGLLVDGTAMAASLMFLRALRFVRLRSRF